MIELWFRCAVPTAKATFPVRTSKFTSGWTPTSDSTHPYQLNRAAELGAQAAKLEAATIPLYHRAHIILIPCSPVLVLSYQCQAQSWVATSINCTSHCFDLDSISNFQSSAREACALPVRRPSFKLLLRCCKVSGTWFCVAGRALLILSIHTPNNQWVCV